MKVDLFAASTALSRTVPACSNVKGLAGIVRGHPDDVIMLGDL